jgi:hypothetical protein
MFKTRHVHLGLLGHLLFKYALDSTRNIFHAEN